MLLIAIDKYIWVEEISQPIKTLPMIKTGLVFRAVTEMPLANAGRRITRIL